MKFFHACVLCCLSIFSSTGAIAACQTAGGNFFPNQNDSVTYYSTSDNGRCGHGFSAGGGTAFTSSGIVRQPRNGTLKQTGPFNFIYNAKAGYKGADTYVIKVCANSQGRPGCSTLTYQMTVQ